MSLLYRKSKVVSFRLSPEEYSAIEKASRNQGFPSLSLFARSATLSFQSAVDMDGSDGVSSTGLWQRLDRLTAQLERIAGKLGAASESPTSWNGGDFRPKETIARANHAETSG